MSIDITLNWKGKEVTTKVINAAVKGLMDGANFLLGQANKTAPHDEGALRRSGDAKVERKDLEAAVYYDTPYAVRLHEDEGTNFSNPNARRKWLERTLQEEYRLVNSHIAKEMKRVF